VSKALLSAVAHPQRCSLSGSSLTMSSKAYIHALQEKITHDLGLHNMDCVEDSLNHSGTCCRQQIVSPDQFQEGHKNNETGIVGF
jgi:DNA-directed RNA polymerase subunit N (RpoN/RPB10)